jgi:hypothetical protein
MFLENYIFFHKSEKKNCASSLCYESARDSDISRRRLEGFSQKLARESDIRKMAWQKIVNDSSRQLYVLRQRSRPSKTPTLAIFESNVYFHSHSQSYASSFS